MKARKRSDARRLGIGMLVISALFLVAVPAPPAAAQAVQIPRAEFGEPFPSGKFQNLNEGAGGAAEIDLSGVLGKVPVIFHYWMPGHTRSEQVLLELQSLVESLGPGKLVLFAVTTPPLGSSDVTPIRARLKELKLRVPVLRDEGLRLAQQTSADRVPAIALIDRAGDLRLTNGASLIQTVEYKTTLEDLIRRLAKTGAVGNFGALPRYDPVIELVGKKAPDFQLPSVSDGVPRRLSSMLAAGKVNVLVFWSVDCPHCKQYIPEINRWVAKNGSGVNVISVARVTNDALRTQTKEFVRLTGLTFPTLLDQDFQIAAADYLVTATPTVLLLRPDGTVHGLMSPSEKDFTKYFEAKRKEMFRPSPARS